MTGFIIVAEPVRAATISDIRKQQEATKKALEEAEGKADALDDQQDAIEEEIGDMDTALVEIMGNITLIEEEIAAKDACRIEHDISSETFEKLKEHISQPRK